MIKTIITKVPIIPYPNILASSEPEILGFRIPMDHFEPPAPRCMFHSAHNLNNLWTGQQRGGHQMAGGNSLDSNSKLSFDQSCWYHVVLRISRFHFLC